MSENDPFARDQTNESTSSQSWNHDVAQKLQHLPFNPVGIGRYVQVAIGPLIFAAIAFGVSDSLFISAVVFVITLGKPILGLTQKNQQHQSNQSTPTPSVSNATTETTGQGHTTSASAVADLKRKLDRLRQANSLDGVDLEESPSREQSIREDAETAAFDQGHTGSTSSDFDNAIAGHSEILKDTTTPRDAPTEKQTEEWLLKLRKLDELVAYGKINDDEYERQYRRIRKTRRL